MMDEFKYKAVIDWIKIEITLTKNTNFMTLRRLFDLNYVEPIDAGSSGATNTFKFRIYDVASWSQLERIYNKINAQYQITSFIFTGVEISFDAYSKSQSKESLLDKTANFYWSLSKPCSNNKRVAGISKGSASAPPRLKALSRKILDGHTLYVGSQNSEDISQRIYYKTTDKNEDLPKELHRARYEITLKGKECPFKTIEEAKSYKLTKLAKWFKFRKIDDDAIGLLKTILKEGVNQLGQINMKRRTGGGMRVNKVGTKADVQLNSIAYEKLRELTIRLKKN